MIRNKLKNIKSKISSGKKRVYITISVMLVFLFTFIVYNINNYDFSKLHASVSEITNNTFKDENFYTCVIDAYNKDNNASKTTQDNLTDTELASITSLNCSSKNIEDTSGIEKITNLTELDLTENELANIDLSSNILLTNLNLTNNKLTSIDLSNNTSLTYIKLRDNLLTNIDLTKNLFLTYLSLRENQIENIDLSKNENLNTLYIDSNRLTNINLGDNKFLTDIDLSYNELTNVDLTNNLKLEELSLDNTKIENLDLSRNTALTSLYIDDTSLKEDILMQVGETYQIEEKIIPPEGQNFTYSIDNTSIATIEGNTIMAQSEGNTTLKTKFGNISFDRKLAVGSVKLTDSSGHYKINNAEKYIYVEDYYDGLFNEIDYDIKTNFGNVMIDGDMLKVVSGSKTYLEYKLVYLDCISVNDKYLILSSYVDDPTNYMVRTVNCTYELLNDGNEISIKYNGQELDKKSVVYLIIPKNSRFVYNTEQYVLFNENFKSDLFNKNLFNMIKNISDINKEKINVFSKKYNLSIKEKNDSDYTCFSVRDDSDFNVFSVEGYSSIYSVSYDLTKDYIYLGSNNFINDVKIKGKLEEEYELAVREYNNKLMILDEDRELLSWNLIKVTSDKYDMSGDTINLGNEDIDLTKINVTNATLKKENNKLLIMYGDEVVKEFKLEGGKKTTTTTKKDDERTTTENTTTKTKKEEVKTTTTKKKISIIDKIFGNKETTTKKEETTTKKNIFRKSTTTKVENSSGNVTSNNKNSFKKLVTGSNLLILLLSITGIALIIYIIIDKKINKKL